MPWSLIPLIFLMGYHYRLFFVFRSIELYLFNIPIALYLSQRYNWKGLIVIIFGNIYFLLSGITAFLLKDYTQDFEIGAHWKFPTLIICIALSIITIKTKSIVKRKYVKRPYFVLFSLLTLLPLSAIVTMNYSGFALSPIFLFFFFIIGFFNLSSSKVLRIFLTAFFISAVSTLYFKKSTVIVDIYEYVRLIIFFHPIVFITAFLFFYVAWCWLSLIEDSIAYKQSRIFYNVLILPIILMLIELFFYFMQNVMNYNIPNYIYFSCAPYILPVGAFFAGLSFRHNGLLIYTFFVLVRNMSISFNVLESGFDPMHNNAYPFLLSGVLHSAIFGLLGIKAGDNTINIQKRNYLEKSLHKIIRLYAKNKNELVLNGPGEWQRQHDEISKTIRKTMFVIITYSFFCILTLSSPDVSLLAVDAKIRVPFAGTNVNYSLFLLIGPLILIGIVIYLYIFLDYYYKLERRDDTLPLPFLFNMNTAKKFTQIIFYLLPFTTLCFFIWKALPRPNDAYLVMLLTLSYCIGSLWAKMNMEDSRLSEVSKKSYLIAFWAAVLFFFVQAYNIKPFFSRPLNLYKANLANHDLKGTDLKGSDLTLAILSGSKLSSAYLDNAILKNANLENSDLTKTSFLYADFTETNLKDANLKGSDLRNAKGLSCEQLKKAVNWEDTYRDDVLLCGKSSLKKEPEQLFMERFIPYKGHPIF